MTGHGHVRPNPDGTVNCGGPGVCSTCALELRDYVAGVDEPTYCPAVRLGDAGDYRLCARRLGHERDHAWSTPLPRPTDERARDVTGNRYRVRTVGEGSRLVVDVEVRRPAGLGVMLDPAASWALALQALEVAATTIPAARRLLDAVDGASPAEAVPVAQLARILADRLEAEADG